MLSGGLGDSLPKVGGREEQSTDFPLGSDLEGIETQLH